MKYEGQVSEPGDRWRSPEGIVLELVAIGSAGECREAMVVDAIWEIKQEDARQRPMRGLGATSGREQQARRAEVHRLNQPVRKLPAGEV